VDLADHWDRDPDQVLDHLVDDGEFGPPGFLAHVVQHVIDVGARAEATTFSRQDHHVSGGVRGQLAEGRPQLVVGLAVQGVDRRMVDRDLIDPAALAGLDELELCHG
jgi:hypothetical protein